MRLQKYLAACGIASRRDAEDLIQAGRVQVNGHDAVLGDTTDPTSDVVTFEGKPVREESLVYILLNKPRGVVTSVGDTHGRKTVMDCIEGVRARVFPVGRLDMDVEGALLLTNDGELAYRLTHPKHEVNKVYLVRVEGELNREAVAQLEQGVPLEDGVTAPAKAAIIHSRHGTTLLRLTLHEGKKREVKRMCAAVGHPVRGLQRVSISGLSVTSLRPGEWRYLSKAEIDMLRSLAQA